MNVEFSYKLKNTRTDKFVNRWIWASNGGIEFSYSKTGSYYSKKCLEDLIVKVIDYNSTEILDDIKVIGYRYKPILSTKINTKNLVSKVEQQKIMEKLKGRA